MDKLHFSIAGIPETTPKPTDIFKGLRRTKEMGLDGMELEFVHSIWLNPTSAPKVDQLRQELGLVLTIHAPYYINLNSPNNKTKYGSLNQIFRSAEIGAMAGVYSVTFHPGYYLTDSKEDTYTHVHHMLEKLQQQLADKKIPDIYIRPETTGRVSQFGELDELLTLSKDFPFFVPCVDFAHLYARANGKHNTLIEFQEILDKVEKALGEKGIHNMHIHYSGIEYTEKGERKHLPLQESDGDYKTLLKVLKERDVKGVLVCESPIRDTDTSLLQRTYNEI